MERDSTMRATRGATGVAHLCGLYFSLFFASAACALSADGFISVSWWVLNWLHTVSRWVYICQIVSSQLLSDAEFSTTVRCWVFNYCRVVSSQLLSDAEFSTTVRCWVLNYCREVRSQLLSDGEFSTTVGWWVLNYCRMVSSQLLAH